MFRAPVDWRIMVDLDQARRQQWEAQAQDRYRAAARAAVVEVPEPPAKPLIIVPATTAVGDQIAPGAAKLAEAAEAGGWSCRLTYALAMDGECMIESCCARYGKPGWPRGWAAWWRRDNGAWSFEGAWIGIHRVGWQRTKRKDGTPGPPTIREILGNR